VGPRGGVDESRQRRRSEGANSAHARRESAHPGPLDVLDRHIAAVEERTAIEIEQSEQTLHALADIKRRAEAIES